VNLFRPVAKHAAFMKRGQRPGGSILCGQVTAIMLCGIAAADVAIGADGYTVMRLAAVSQAHPAPASGTSDFYNPIGCTGSAVVAVSGFHKKDVTMEVGRGASTASFRNGKAV
jgi:hypothetical protein